MQRAFREESSFAFTFACGWIVRLELNNSRCSCYTRKIRDLAEAHAAAGLLMVLLK